MQIKAETYSVWTEGSDVYFDGTMRLSGTQAYQPILELLQEVLAEKPPSMTLDLTNLEFLNSSGINLLAKFTIELRKHSDTRLVVRATSEIPWQAKSIRNLQKLHPGLTLIMT
ncbi:hypothetical protein OF122_13705 [Pelagibacterium flavum]|uniref:STAS domain-containing protein n=1 Tax=Pelagibacterium flavum TaxID=2984530 RepID=A0ABY6IKI1_9HYPH|nr:hypothetical protein [Pelagibacterium sp. YIM 151497]UYQ71104.1 hypothetical protein OF122_13705 [Pelagibacterium sp. YIM 151497]